MSLTQIRKILITGFAMFAMLFGSGNVIFPLILGKDSGNQLLWGLLGFLLTAVLVPLLGLFATMLSCGDYKIFLAPLGKIPSFLMILICMVLLGPFALIPRCIVISYAAIKIHLPALDLFFFAIFCALLIFACTIKNSIIVDLLGRFFGPLKIILLLTLIIRGLLNPSLLMTSDLTPAQGFVKGLLSGYGTCDLLATIFLAGLIMSGLSRGMHPEKRKDARSMLLLGIQASLIGGILLALVYMGFSIVAGFHAKELVHVERGDVFSKLAIIILGQEGGLLANITIAISCLATAISLTAIFAMYLHKDLFGGRLSYKTALIITSLITACVTNLGFSRIMKLLSPIIQVIYPVLIIYTLWHIIDKVRKLNKQRRLSITLQPVSSDWGQ
jgi:LIVCS family branched-chain amino acid:cation transporter